MDDSNKDVSLRYDFHIQGSDFANAGDASSRIRKILLAIGVKPDLVRRACIASYEAEMNIVIHAYHGRLILDADLKRIQISADDSGPGMDDIEKAMTPGFSTAPDSIREMGFGAGMGLPNMKNCSDEFDINTKKGVGTIVRMVFFNE